MLPTALAPLLTPNFLTPYTAEMDLDQLPQLLMWYQLGLLNGAEMQRLMYSLTRRRGNRHFHWHQGGGMGMGMGMDPRLLMLMNAGGMGGMGGMGGAGWGMGMGMGGGMGGLAGLGGLGGMGGLPGIVGVKQLLLQSPFARNLF
ncbi:hypothetical protein M409DRAFT_21776 [Zasmidium cellare ATCC 36951]|uniref:Uncharacterized protein n=1 Tax=Zasmidium cellare ATCC 36951 TaxID=1080233 RepID=A0A6A6CR86_ZASCE|nr:uncharacterized protein M409DRAFT_21776 [Zasmidium cellare ATCC 36951]KAF2168342.1 hypothetical protein M409DRAFT_21776 [Zasmidium cellare ATCC 36951]